MCTPAHYTAVAFDSSWTTIIFSRERQLASAKREAAERIAQVRSAVRARLAQPSTLFVMTGLGVVLGAWFVRRNGPQAGKDIAPARKPIVGLAYTFLIRFGLQRLADAWTCHRDLHVEVATQTAKP